MILEGDGPIKTHKRRNLLYIQDSCDIKEAQSEDGGYDDAV